MDRNVWQGTVVGGNWPSAYQTLQLVFSHYNAYLLFIKCKILDLEIYQLAQSCILNVGRFF